MHSAAGERTAAQAISHSSTWRARYWNPCALRAAAASVVMAGPDDTRLSLAAREHCRQTHASPFLPVLIGARTPDHKPRLEVVSRAEPGVASSVSCPEHGDPDGETKLRPTREPRVRAGEARAEGGSRCG